MIFLFQNMIKGKNIYNIDIVVNYMSIKKWEFLTCIPLMKEELTNFS